MASELTVEQFSKALPAQLRKKVDTVMLDNINNTITDPVVRDAYRENLVSYASVMADGRFKMTSYLDAVKYVSYKLLGKSNVAAYSATFPDRFQKLVDAGTSNKDISSYVAMYAKNKLVNLIMEQTLIPTHVLNADLYQKALNVQADLMVNANSEKVRTDAANSILSQLKPPEIKKVELDVSVKEDQSIKELREATLDLAAQQRKALEAGAMNAKDVAHSTVIQGECEVVE